ncbi:MAG TPA: glycosyltransferase, partial [Janthinobacterium sp.]|nr:glycosyltransferase [Janthinobacterium sp.]
LHAEQGLGDTLQFCRYASLVAQRGAIVILEVKKPLAGLLGTLAGVARIVIKGEPLPPFDYHIPLMSLPLAFDTRLGTVPGAAPYLASDQAKVAQWGAILGAKTRPRVGVVWSGHPANPNDHNRSMPLSVFARMFSDQYEFISLQKEVKPADQPLLDSMPVRQLADLLRDFTDTAALCELMDVVITVDTSVAHLAGALGKPVWVLLQTPFEWRWLERGTDSPWYPSATLYRQSQRGDWEPVIDALAADLGKLAASQVPRG